MKAALKLLESESSGGLLPLDHCTDDNMKTVLDILKSKHLPLNPLTGVDFDSDTISAQEPHPVLYDQIEGSLIRSTVLRMDGAAGPSGLDISNWKRYTLLLENTHLIFAMCSLLCVVRSAQNFSILWA